MFGSRAAKVAGGMYRRQTQQVSQHLAVHYERGLARVTQSQPVHHDQKCQKIVQQKVAQQQ